MFCPNCGTQVADTAAFCRACGASMREEAAPPQEQPAQQPVEQQPVHEQQPAPPQQPVYQQPAPPPQPVMTQQRPAATPAARRPLMANPNAQPLVGIAAVAGSAAAALGSFLPWIKSGGYTSNGFDSGYITGSSMNDGSDGILVLLLGLGAAALAVHYFMKKNALLSLGTLVLAAAAAGIAGYNFIKLYQDINDAGAAPMDYLSYGLYMAIAGGAIAAVAAFMGLRREQAM